MSLKPKKTGNFKKCCENTKTILEYPEKYEYPPMHKLTGRKKIK